MPVGDTMDGDMPGFALDEYDVSVARVRTVVEVEGGCATVELLLPAMVDTFG